MRYLLIGHVGDGTTWRSRRSRPRIAAVPATHLVERAVGLDHGEARMAPGVVADLVAGIGLRGRGQDRRRRCGHEEERRLRIDGRRHVEHPGREPGGGARRRRSGRRWGATTVRPAATTRSVASPCACRRSSGRLGPAEVTTVVQEGQALGLADAAGRHGPTQSERRRNCRRCMAVKSYAVKPVTARSRPAIP